MARVPAVLGLALFVELAFVVAPPKWFPALLRPAEASDAGIWSFALILAIGVLAVVHAVLMRCPYCLHYPASRKPYHHGDPIVFNVSRCDNCQMPLK